MFRNLYSKVLSSSSSIANSTINASAAVTGSEVTIASLTSQLNEARNQLSEVQKNYKLLSGDHDALRNISLEQCDELILISHHNQEKLLQRRVSNETYL